MVGPESLWLELSLDLQEAGSTGSVEPNFFSDFPPNYELCVYELQIT